MRSPAFALPLVLATSLAAQTVTTVAGIGEAGLRDGGAHQATFDRPTWLDLDRASGAIYVVDRANHRVRKILNGNVSTLAGMTQPWFPPPTPITFDFGGPFGGGIAVEPMTAGCGGGIYNHGIFVSSSNTHQLLHIVDIGPHMSFADRDDSSPRIGSGTPGALDDMQLRAQFNNPGDVALSWGYTGRGAIDSPDALYIADTGNHSIRRIRFRMSFEFCAQPYYVSTLATGFNAPRGVASAPDGSVYVADTGHHAIRRIAPDGVVTTVAGKLGVAGNIDGVATEALLNSPSGIDVNELGEVFIGDTGNYVIRKLTLDGRLITIAGTPGVAGFVDGPARAARFSGVVGVRVDGNFLYMADTANNAIRKLDMTPREPRRRAARH